MFPMFIAYMRLTLRKRKLNGMLKAKDAINLSNLKCATLWTICWSAYKKTLKRLCRYRQCHVFRLEVKRYRILSVWTRNEPVISRSVTRSHGLLTSSALRRLAPPLSPKIKIFGGPIWTATPTVWVLEVIGDRLGLLGMYAEGRTILKD